MPFRNACYSLIRLFLQLIALEDLIHECLFICMPDQCRREATIEQKIIRDGFIEGRDNFRSGFVTFCSQ